MGAWDDLTLGSDVLRGISKIDLSLGEVPATDTTLKAAKSKARTMLMEKLSSQISQYTSVDSFFDDLAEDTSLDGELAQLLGYAYAHVYYFDLFQMEGDQNWIRARDFKESLKTAVSAIARLAPHALGLVTGSKNTHRSVAVNSLARWWPQR